MTVKFPKVNIVLDESMYGVSQLSPGPAYSFYSFHKGKFETITTRNSADLIAVTKEQYASWKGKDIRVIPVEIV
jgi:hypothetical protein